MTSRAKLRRIDAVQLGTTGRDEEREVMRELVTDPRAGELWFEALRRRRRIDRVAALVRAAPWLARPHAGDANNRSRCDSGDVGRVVVDHGTR